MSITLDNATGFTLECVGCGDQAEGHDHGAYVAAPTGWLRHLIVDAGELVAWCPTCAARTLLVIERSRRWSCR